MKLFKFKMLLFCLVCSFSYTDLHAVNMVCGIDLDNDGYTDGENETTACLQTQTTSYFCPLNAVDCSSTPVSDLDEGECAANGGSWKGETIKESEVYSYNKTYWFQNGSSLLLKYNGSVLWSGSTSSLGQSKTIGDWTYSYGQKRGIYSNVYAWGVIRSKEEEPTCSFPDGRTHIYSSPLEGGICESVNGTYMDAVTECLDLDTAEPVEEFDLTGDMLIDDGTRDGEGNCVDEVLLFTGRGQTCKKKGLQSAFQDCCKYDGQISTVDVGSYQQTKLKLDAIRGIYSIGKAAYSAYATASAAGASTAAAASAAGSAAGSQAVVAFDPTTLAVAATIYLVTEWIANACSEGDLDTAAAKAANHCVEVGSFCSKRYTFIGCVQRKRSFCCFNGKMQRIFQEQGRPQLSTFNGFGSAKNPDCRGFTPEEFQSIDFSKIDLSEYYGDLNHNTSTEVNAAMTSKTESFYESVQ